MKILNFGSLNLDYVYSVDHFVRGGETLDSRRREIFCGGKGLNQSVAFARAGAQVYHAGLIGTDGNMLKELLDASGVDIGLIRLTDETATGHAIIQVTPAGENCILLYGGANRCVTEAMIDEVLSNFEAGDLLMLQNEINGLSSLIDAAHRRGLSIALNPSPFNEVISALDFSKLDWLILNETEGRELSGKMEPEDILSELLARYPRLRIVLTLGGDGSVYADGATRIRQAIFPATP